MSEWAKLLLSANPTLETNMDKQTITSQATFQMILYKLTLLFILNTNQALLICLQRTLIFQITNVLLNIMFIFLTSTSHSALAESHHASSSIWNASVTNLREIALLSYNSKFLTQMTRASLIQFQIPLYQITLSQKTPLPYQKPTYLVHNIKTLTQLHIHKTYSMLTRSLSTFILP